MPAHPTRSGVRARARTQHLPEAHPVRIAPELLLDRPPSDRRARSASAGRERGELYLEGATGVHRMPPADIVTVRGGGRSAQPDRSRRSGRPPTAATTDSP